MQLLPRHASRRAARPSRLQLLLPGLVLALAVARGDVQIERLTLPHRASPSSFAVGLPGGTSFCFDPVRGSINYMWSGGFLDVTPARPGPGKFIGPATLLGPVVYQESGPAPLRRGHPQRVSTPHFLGYTVRPAAIEFRYAVDGVLVREEIALSPDGARLIRRLQIHDESATRWWRVIDGQEPAALERDATGTAVIELSLSGAG